MSGHHGLNELEEGFTNIDHSFTSTGRLIISRIGEPLPISISAIRRSRFSGSRSTCTNILFSRLRLLLLCSLLSPFISLPQHVA